MDRGLYGLVLAALADLGIPFAAGPSYAPRRFRYADALIIAVFLRAAINDRPVCRACVPSHWPDDLRPRRPPSQPQMPRRLRARGVTESFARLDRRVHERDEPEPLVPYFDGKPLPVSAHGHDKEATWGRSAGGLARGCKPHARHGPRGRVLDWALAPMHIDERPMAHAMPEAKPAIGYVLGDKNDDPNKPHACATRGGAQPVTPRRYAPGKGLGRTRHAARAGAAAQP